MEAWKRQLLRHLFPYGLSRATPEIAMLAKHPHIPARLYKYRSFSPTHLDALRRNVLWMSAPEKFNDPFEAAVRLYPDRFLVENQTVDAFISTVKEMIDTVSAGGIWVPKALVNPIPAGQWRQKVIEGLLKNESPDIRARLSGVMDAFLRDQQEKMSQRMSESFRRGFSVLSLCENSTSTLMWSHYSDSHRGFCIEYDFSALPANDLLRRLCFPVFYTGKPRDATRYMAKGDLTDFNNLFGQYMCLIKHDSWADEKEWRIIQAIGPAHANFEINMPQPSAILIGAHSTPANELKMRDFCRDQSIPLLKAVIHPGKFDLEFATMSVA